MKYVHNAAGPGQATRVPPASLLSVSCDRSDRFAGCSTALPKIAGAPSTPQVRDEPWRAPAGVVPAETRADPNSTVAAAVDSIHAAGPLVLGQVVDMALRSNPQTAVSWAQARVGASQYGAVRGSLYPTVDATANIINTQTTSQTGTSLRSTITPTASLSYVLLDFGGRAGNIAAARAAAVALDNLTHNATLQERRPPGEAAYFNYQATRSLLEAARSRGHRRRGHQSRLGLQRH